MKDLVKLLRDAGYGVCLGEEAVRAKIAEMARPDCAAALQKRVEELEKENGDLTTQRNLWEHAALKRGIEREENRERAERAEARLERLKPYLQHKPECGYYRWRWVPTGATGEIGKFKQATGPCDCGFEEATK